MPSILITYLIEQVFSGLMYIKLKNRKKIPAESCLILIVTAKSI